MKSREQPTGFSLVEVIVALMILSVGVLAMGASTGHVMAQIQASELRSERIGAVRQAAEVLRSVSFNSLGTECQSASANFSTDNFDLTCSVSQVGTNLREVRIISTGPGFRDGRLILTLADTFAITVANRP